MPPLDTNAHDVAAFYRRHAGIYDLSRWVTLHGRTKAVRASALESGDSVLDLGCGTGLAFEALRKRVGTSGHVTGVDFSPHMLKRAQTRVARHNWHNLTLLRADLYDLELGRQYDAVMVIYTLSMVAQWRQALERAIAHVAPGGRLVILDFGRFRHGGAQQIFQRWLQANHTCPGRPYAAQLRRLCPHWRLRETYGLHGYFQLVVASAPESSDARSCA